MLAILGLIAGIVVGLILQPQLPVGLQPYVPIMIVAALDGVIGAVRAMAERTFSERVFVVSFVSNVIIAALLVLLGDLLGVGSQLSTAVIVVFGIRIFTNAASLRRTVLGA